MIIGRSPLRITLGGGGTDLPSYYKQYGGFLISAAINLYVYTTIHQTYIDEILIRYSQIERVKSVNDINHPIIREALLLTGIIGPNIEITALADQSSGTGLGSSGSFTTCLLKTLHKFKKCHIAPQQLAEMACHIELDLLKEPIGKQDQYIAAFGGVTVFEFEKNDSVKIRPLNITESISNQLEENLVMFSTGFYRSASKVLKEQDDKSKLLDHNMIDNLHYVKELGYKSLEALETGNLIEFGKIMHEHWQHKKKRSSMMSNPEIDNWYELAMNNGAIGGKLCFVPETQIKTEHGYKYISNISTDEKVYDHQNNLQNVIEVIKRPYTGKLIHLKVTGLKNPILVTPEHPFLTSIKHPKNNREIGKNGKKQSIINLCFLKDAKSLKKGNCLLIPVDTNIIDLEKIKIKRDVKQSIYSNHNIYDDIPEELDINFNLLNVLGWFIAEGSNSYKQFNFSLNKLELNDAKILINNFGKTLTIKKNGENGISVVGSSVVLSAILSEWCGKLAENKKIPDWAMKLPAEKQAILLSALWRGDGCERVPYDKRTKKSYHRCAFKTVSFKLAKQVQELCFRLGFICSIKEEKNLKPKIICNNKKESVPQTAYTISIGGEDAHYFNEFIQTGNLISFKRKNKKKISLKKDFIKINDIVYVKRSIREIKEIYYCGDVFNLNVNNSHTYIANDVAVHNCGAGGGGFLMFYAEEKERLRKVMREAGLKELDINFDYEGTKIL